MIFGHGPVRFSAAGAESEIETGARDKPSMMVKTVSGTPSWVVVYQGSPNKQDWTTFMTHDSTSNTSGETISTGAERYPYPYRRLYCVSVSGGIVEALGWAI